MKEKDQMNAILVEAVREGLSNICSSAAPSVLFYLEKKDLIKSINIENLQTFAKGLENIFGIGAEVIERKILKVLYIKLRFPQLKENQDKFEFAKEVGKAIELYKAK